MNLQVMSQWPGGERLRTKALATVITFLVTICAIASWAGPARAQQPERQVVLLLDGSISMWARMPKDGIRLNVMKAGVQSYLEEVAKTAGQGAAWSMLAYGYQSKSSCSDVTTLKTRGAFDLAAMKAGLARLQNPKGRSLVANGLSSGVAQIGRTNASDVIVMVVDGRDRCGQDMCAIARKLKQDAPNARAHVIGLNLADPDIQALQCVSRLTGGRFANATDREQLVAALRNAIGQAAQPAPQAVNADKPGLVLSARLGEKSAPLGDGVTWLITPEEGEKQATSLVQTQLNQTQALAPGRYKVLARFRGLVADGVFDVGKSKPSVASLVFDGGLLSLETPVLSGDAAGSAGDGANTFNPMLQVRLLPRRDGVRPRLLSLRKAETIALEAGQYTVDIRAGATHVMRDLEIAAGETKKMAALATIGMARIKGTALAGGGALSDVVYRVLQVDLDAKDGNRTVAIGRGGEVQFILAAGNYTIEAEAAGIKTRSRLQIRPGSIVRQQVVIPIGQIKLATQIAGSTNKFRSGVTYRIESTSGGRVRQTTASEKDVFIGAGSYRISVRIGDSNARAEKTVTVSPGSQQDVIMSVRAGSVRFRLDQTVDISRGKRPYWEVRDQSGQVVYTSARTAPDALLALGTYQVIARVGALRLSKRFDVSSPQPQLVRIGLE